MEVVRDLGRIEPWQESLERSRARRTAPRRSAAKTDQRQPGAAKPDQRRPSAGKPNQRQPSSAAPGQRERSSAKPHQRQPSPGKASQRQRERHRAGTSRDRPTADRPRPRSQATASRIRVRRGIAFLALVVPVAVLFSVLAGRGTQSSAVAPQANAAAHAQRADSGGPERIARWRVPAGTTRTRACEQANGPNDYVNPLGRARVTPERIDQGVDYAGSGKLAAIGRAKVTHVARTATGWPGAFIEYRLLDGPDVGCYVYYAEGVNPAAGLRVGQTVAAGQPIARIITGWPTGIEIGWGAGISTATYAARKHQWSARSDQNSIATAAGKSFSALVASLGGPPGKVER